LTESIIRATNKKNGEAVSICFSLVDNYTDEITFKSTDYSLTIHGDDLFNDPQFEMDNLLEFLKFNDSDAYATIVINEKSGFVMRIEPDSQCIVFMLGDETIQEFDWDDFFFDPEEILVDIANLMLEHSTT
jgi:hypothetical protein